MPVWVTRSISSTRGVLTLFLIRPASACHAHGSGGSSLKSCPVNTATTPGCFAAFLVLMLLIFACAYGVRRIAAYNMPGNCTSSRYNASPVIRRGSSLRLIEAPTDFVDIASSFMWASSERHVSPLRQCSDSLYTGRGCHPISGGFLHP